MRTGGDEMRSPKYAHIELERRWLVDRASRPNIDGLAHTLIEDRYIDGTRCRLRRMADRATGEIIHKLTRKYEAEDPTARPIVTAYLTDHEFEIFARLPAHNLTKQRYTIEDGALRWSLDCFDGRLSGLELVEIECENERDLRTLMPPSWSIREISHEPDYQGGSLAVNGVPKE